MIRHMSHPKYKESNVEWLGDVPSHWSVLPLWTIAEHNRHSLPENTPKDYRFRYVDISSVAHGKGIVASEDMDFGSAPSRARRLAEPGDIVVSTVRTYLKAVGTVTENHRNHVFSTGFAVLHAKSNCHPDFLHWLIENERLIQAIEAHSEGLGYPAINASTLMRLKTALPPRDEQQAISDRLSRETTRIDTLIEKKTRFIGLLTEKRAAMITQAVTTGLDPDVPMKDSGVEWLGFIPMRWQHSKIRYLAKLESGHTPSRQVSAYWENCTIPWFTLADIWQVRREGRQYIDDTSEYVSELGLANSSARKLPPGTVVLSRTASVGFPAILSREMAVSQDFAAWICGDSLDNAFLYWSLVAMRRELDRLTMGSTHKTIYMPDIADLRVAAPPIAEQRLIVEWLEAQASKIDKIITATKRSITLLKERRSALITAAVTGKIDVRAAA